MTANACHNESMPRVLLQTAAAYAVSGQKQTLVRIVLDTGSSRTYITTDIVRKLSLPVIGTVNTKLFVFAQKPTVQSLDIVQLTLKSRYDNALVIVNALVVPVICESMNSMPPDSNITNFAKVYPQLADVGSNEKVSVLIGADYYDQVANGAVYRLT